MRHDAGSVTSAACCECQGTPRERGHQQDDRDATQDGAANPKIARLPTCIGVLGFAHQVARYATLAWPEFTKLEASQPSGPTCRYARRESQSLLQM
jgi:hypothetical protein